LSTLSHSRRLACDVRYVDGLYSGSTSLVSPAAFR
jgi:hypothetical protein